MFGGLEQHHVPAIVRRRVAARRPIELRTQFWLEHRLPAARQRRGVRQAAQSRAKVAPPLAPGLRQRILTTAVRSPRELAAGNANYVGGDILTGANTPIQVGIRPRLALDPYRTGVPGLFIGSAATPPGAGVHGMCGYNAARSVLRYLGGVS